MTREQKITRWIKKWQRLLLLDHWNVSVRHEMGQSDGDANTMAEISVRTQYLEATIVIFDRFWTPPESVTEEDDGYREDTIAHELSHIHVAPLVALVERARRGEQVPDRTLEDAKEAATETISRIATRIARH